MFVIVSTHRDADQQPQAGAVYGPFQTKPDAEAALAGMDFPYPEAVFIRRVGGF